MPRTNYQYRRRLLRQGLLLGSVALLALGVLAPPMFAWSAEQVLVCHRPPGNPSAFETKPLPPGAVAAHLAHGDNVVGPEVCDGVDNDCNGKNDDIEDAGTCTGEGFPECKNSGINVCAAGGLQCTAAPPDACCQQCAADCRNFGFIAGSWTCGETQNECFCAFG
jgi:hypothetical protein